jgi:hypothetical protein
VPSTGRTNDRASAAGYGLGCARIREALRHDGFTLLFQPIVNLSTRAA